MLDIFTSKVIKWIIIPGSVVLSFQVYGVATGATEFVSPIHTQATQAQTPTILPDGANPETTPVTTLGGINIPEESPNGGSPTGWADNSPVYSDGWMLQVNDSTHTISWIAPTNEYGAGNGALCGTDAQCADYSRSIGEEPSGYAKGK